MALKELEYSFFINFIKEFQGKLDPAIHLNEIESINALYPISDVEIFQSRNVLKAKILLNNLRKKFIKIFNQLDRELQCEFRKFYEIKLSNTPLKHLFELAELTYACAESSNLFPLALIYSLNKNFDPILKIDDEIAFEVGKKLLTFNFYEVIVSSCLKNDKFDLLMKFLKCTKNEQQIYTAMHIVKGLIELNMIEKMMIVFPEALINTDNTFILEKIEHLKFSVIKYLVDKNDYVKLKNIAYLLKQNLDKLLKNHCLQIATRMESWQIENQLSKTHSMLRRLR